MWRSQGFDELQLEQVVEAVGWSKCEGEGQFNYPCDVAVSGQVIVCDLVATKMQMFGLYSVLFAAAVVGGCC